LKVANDDRKSIPLAVECREGEDDCRIRRDKTAMNTDYLSELLMVKGLS
jgi:hypothetical protein